MRLSSTFFAIPVSCLIFARLLTATDSRSVQPITDEKVRLAVLGAIFPGMEIGVVPGKKIDTSGIVKQAGLNLLFPDAMKDEAVYAVRGDPTNAAEREASENILGGALSHVREARLKLFRWPGSVDSEFAAVLQYRFPDANPPMSSPSLGIVVHVKLTGPERVIDRYLLESSHHTGIQRVTMADLHGDGTEQLIVESDWGGAGSAGSSVTVFGFRDHKLTPIFETPTKVMHEDQDLFTEVFDASRTLQRHSNDFCFTKTVLFEAGVYQRAHLTKACYQSGGVDLKAAQERSVTLERFH